MEQSLDCSYCASTVARSMGATLLAAASTFALFIMSNWELGIAIHSGGRQDLFDRCFHFLRRAMLAVFFPFLPFVVSAWNAWCVWMMMRKLHENKPELLKKLDRATVAIMTLCPILIQLPQGTDKAQLVHSYLIDNTTEEMSENALQLSPRQEFMEGGERPKGDSPSPDGDSIAITRDNIQGGEPLKGNSPSRDDDSITIAHDNVMGDGEQHGQSHSVKSERLYLKLHQTLGDIFDERSRWMRVREVLLELEVVPGYEQLRLLRSRTTFQVVVTGCEALGYMLGVVDRVIELG